MLTSSSLPSPSPSTKNSTNSLKRFTQRFTQSENKIKAGKDPEKCDRDTRRYLHSCLLVNIQWCQAAIPILWRNSFYFCRGGNAHLIETYISCFNSSERQTLISAGVILPISRYPRPAFPYAAMLKRLDYDRFCNSVDIWCNKTDQERYNAIVIMMRALFRLFLTRSVILLHLVLGEWIDKTSTDLKYRRIIEDEFKDLLQPVKKLKVQGDFVKDCILKGLQYPCTHLDKLFVYLSNTPQNYSYNEELTSLQELIVSQKRLKSLKLGNINPNLLFPSLITQSKTLTSIHLLGCGFNEEVPWTYLTQCSNLEKLKFRDCTGFSERMIEALISSLFPRLKLLAIVGECKTLNGDFVTRDYCDVLIEWGIEQGALVTVGIWDFVDAWIKFGTNVYTLRFRWNYAGQFHNIYRKYFEALRQHADIFQDTDQVHAQKLCHYHPSPPPSPNVSMPESQALNINIYSQSSTTALFQTLEISEIVFPTGVVNSPSSSPPNPFPSSSQVQW
ncbi:708_t:CDS:2 [Diversispora eburnea]|uniref:708_t:CDS:1 n=1 Tax=Diversispora eburnea TaxID=1213867 RepID=A0A9N8VJJ6_9GLOM|nr:708_t:CDS:2 [Diversispora eburnea]